MRREIYTIALLLATICCKAQTERQIICYYASWSTYRIEAGRMNIEDIDPNICTHLVYSFVGLSEDSKIEVLDPLVDCADYNGKGGFKRLTNLKKINPNLKVLVSVGGWSQGSIKYSTLLENSRNRNAFVQDAVNFLKKHNFDGLDLDWEYPNSRGGMPADVQTFSFWCKDLREEFDKHGFLLTAAISADEKLHKHSYDIAEISKYLHFINVMTYDYQDSLPLYTITSHYAPLYPSNGDTRNLNIENSIKSLIDNGAPPEKIMLGISSYGRTFRLPTKCVKSKCTVSGAGKEGLYIPGAERMAYNEICLKKDIDLFWDYEAEISYMIDGNQWISYDNRASVKRKVDFIKKLNLGGAMFWTIDTDDFSGACGDGKFPLLSTIKNEFNALFK